MPGCFLAPETLVTFRAAAIVSWDHITDLTCSRGKIISRIVITALDVTCVYSLTHTIYNTSLILSGEGETKCYENLGCFTNDYPYWSVTRPVSIFPQSPESINTQFFLFTQQNTDQYQVIKPRDLSSLQQSYFSSSRNSVFIIHGYMDLGDAPWVVEICQAILEREDVNCLCVDWSGGSGGDYLRTMNNVQVVGAEIAYLINSIVENYGCSLSAIHMIGHSLGCQICGEAGKRQQGIGRITCLDGARQGFEGESTEITIDPTDADFVVSLHTDAGLIGFGMTTKTGHKDFFPNGGKTMTGCEKSQLLNVNGLSNLSGEAYNNLICNHLSAYNMFTSSIRNPEGFMGYCAPDYSSFQKGAGFPCSGDSCSLMGYYTEPGETSSCRTYYLNTGPLSNYERWRYRVTVQTGGDTIILGSISVTMYNSSESSDEHKIYSGPEVGAESYSALVDGLFPPPIVRVTFSWHNSIPLLNPTLWAESVTLTYGNDGAEYAFCSDETTRGNNPQTLTPCL
ncbi:pancreatic lipase-related protein 2-like [Hyla sarda]|uniref:pancreatic lipase-related protein 2-like n=1 Tax=Hyla sarda TaxID=327740 RepID=UPI0024C217A1|nr:pancreatic lipase-related protein 2-like [Hyla sarda]